MKILILDSLKKLIWEEDLPKEMTGLINNIYEVLDLDEYGYYIVPKYHWYIPKGHAKIVDYKTENKPVRTRWYSGGKLEKFNFENMKSYLDLINEQYYNRRQHGFYPEQIDCHTNNPIYRAQNDIQNEQYKETNALYAKLNQEINEIRKKYQPEFNAIHKKYSDLSKKRLEESLNDLSDHLIEKLEGKVLIHKNYANPNSSNFTFFIGKIEDIKAEIKVPKRVSVGHIINYNDIWITLTLENGHKIENYLGNVTNNLRSLDKTIKYLEKNKGKHLIFSGAKINDITGYMKKKPRTKTIGSIFYNQEKRNLEITIESVGIITFPKIGDFLTINDEYIFDPDYNFEIIHRRIDAVDPYGEEDWSDEIPWD